MHREEIMIATDTLRMIVGFSIISSHILSFAIILLSGSSLLPTQRQELALLISPVFAVYVASIVRKFTTLVSFDQTPVNPAFCHLRDWHRPGLFYRGTLSSSLMSEFSRSIRMTVQSSHGEV